MREEEKIKAGILFNPGDPELKAIKLPPALEKAFGRLSKAAGGFAKLVGGGLK